MKLTYYGHACFAVQLAGKNVLFDPFITPNELAKNIDVNKVPADFILVSHGHGDHIADCEAIAKRTQAQVISSFEICNWLAGKGVENYHPMNTGGKRKFDFGTLRCVSAIHSSGLPDGTYGGNPMGFVVSSGEKNIYYSGDTALTMDMELIPRWGKVDVAVLCIGDNFTMGYEDAIETAKMVQCTTVVGVHYDTFGYIKIDREKVKQAFNEAGITLHLPEIGETIEL